MNKSRIIEIVKEITAAYFGISIEDLESKERTRARTVPRNIAIYILSEVFRFKYGEIHKHFKRDRSTIYHAIEVMEYDLLTVKRIKVDYDIILREVNRELNINEEINTKCLLIA
jgi:chromosomal replication initiator protein